MKVRVHVLNSVDAVVMMKILIFLLKFVGVDIEYTATLDFVKLLAFITANL